MLYYSGAYNSGTAGFNNFVSIGQEFTCINAIVGKISLILITERLDLNEIRH